MDRCSTAENCYVVSAILHLHTLMKRPLPTGMQRDQLLLSICFPLQGQETHFQQGCRGTGSCARFASPFKDKRPTSNMDAEGLAVFFPLQGQETHFQHECRGTGFCTRFAQVQEIYFQHGCRGTGHCTRFASPFKAKKPTSSMDTKQLADALNLLPLSGPRDPLPAWMWRDWLLCLICFLFLQVQEIHFQHGCSQRGWLLCRLLPFKAKIQRSRDHF